VEQDVNSELQRYHTEIRNTTHLNDDNALKFWMDRESVYSRLSRLGQDLVAAPASQAYVERLFSLCGELTAGMRNRTTVTLCRRVFL